MNSKRNNSAVERLLKNLDSVELKELRKQFHSQYSENLQRIDRAEQEELRIFVDNLGIDLSWYGTQCRDAVSLNRYNLSLEYRKKLDEISGAISRAFHDLDELKSEVARAAKRDGTPFSKRFTTTLKRMNRYKEKYS